MKPFFGSGSEVYVSENNLYLVTTKYENYYLKSSSVIYKFKLDSGKVTAMASGEIPGYVNDQFSLDEYNGNLRIATTIYTNNQTIENDGIVTSVFNDSNYTNQLTILDENLNQIGAIENIEDGEKIYSVRFMGDVGYIVTFEQVDPLLVVDLSDPENPEIKGKLEIPGYSSYLHPYDETHIIGIGYNTKSNGYGGITTDNMKMSMFDVSDLNNPKEIFSIDIGDNYVYSEILYNHKALFYNKDKNLIGFPITYYSKTQKSGLMLYKIDLENNKFIEYSNLIRSGYSEYKYQIQRAIYIDNTLYTLAMKNIFSYDLETLEQLNEIELNYTNDSNYSIEE